MALYLYKTDRITTIPIKGLVQHSFRSRLHIRGVKIPTYAGRSSMALGDTRFHDVGSASVCNAVCTLATLDVEEACNSI